MVAGSAAQDERHEVPCKSLDKSLGSPATSAVSRPPPPPDRRTLHDSPRAGPGPRWSASTRPAFDPAIEADLYAQLPADYAVRPLPVLSATLVARP